MHNLDLNLSDITKIEGKASCEIKIRRGKIEKCNFQVAEYKRFYTQSIRGKDIMSLPQLTARICGTCSNAHLLCALKAVEKAVGLVPSPQTILLRKLLNYGLIIRDHALHLCVFVLPDIFGKDSILDFDENNPLEHKFLDLTFRIKATGNNLGKRVGGRSVHAPNLLPGGFTKIPPKEELQKSLFELLEIRPLVLELIDIFAEKDGVLKRDDLQFSAMVDSELSFLSGEILSSGGEKIIEEQYGDYLEHVSIPYSQASGYRWKGKIFMVGALARLNLGKENLHSNTKKDVQQYLRYFPSKNIFHNNLAQAIEILHAIDSSIEIIKNLEIKEEKPFPIKRKRGKGVGIIEAPRGTLYYKLVTDDTGKIQEGQIVVPTNQNQIGIEASIRAFLEQNIKKLDSKEKIEWEIERIVRAYDPCMSCASHFLKFKWL